MGDYSEGEIELLKVWKAKAAGWRWLHYNSMALYKRINTNFTYCSILLSTVAGAGGFSTAGSSSKTRLEFYLGYIIGGINVVIGLINSVQRFGKPAEKTELHASAAMQYAMLYRLLETEISLNEKHRRSDLLSTVRTEMDRLLAQSPMIPQKIVNKFNKEFPNTVHKPDICNGLGGEKNTSISQPSSPFGVARHRAMEDEITTHLRSAIESTVQSPKEVLVDTSSKGKEDQFRHE
jgi:hypothetical protein